MSGLSPEHRQARKDAVAAYASQGKKLPEIAQLLGIRYEILRQWLKNQNLRADCAKIRVQTTPRLCLRCRNEFPSEGKHNRLCSDCRSAAHAVSTYAADPGGNTGRQKQAVLRNS